MSEAVAKLRAPKPLTQLDEEFFANCAEERLCFQCCTDCGAWRHLPRMMCARCGSAEWTWQSSSGRGHLFSWTVTHRAVLPEFKDQTPYVVAVVELEEGVRMVTALRGVAPAELALDLALEVTFESLPGGGALPVFRPAS